MGAPGLLHLRKATLSAACSEPRKREIHILGLLEEYYGIIYTQQRTLKDLKKYKWLWDYAQRQEASFLPGDNNILVVMREKPLQEFLVHITEVEELKVLPIKILCESAEKLIEREGAAYLCSFCPFSYDISKCDNDSCETAYMNYVEEYYDQITDLIIKALSAKEDKKCEITTD